MLLTEPSCCDLNFNWQALNAGNGEGFSKGFQSLSFSLSNVCWARCVKMWDFIKVRIGYLNLKHHLDF